MTGYQAAYEQAKQERAEIRAAIERMLARSEMLGKLLESLSPFVTDPQLTGAGAPAGEESSTHEPAPHVPA